MCTYRQSTDGLLPTLNIRAKFLYKKIRKFADRVRIVSSKSMPTKARIEPIDSSKRWTKGNDNSTMKWKREKLLSKNYCAGILRFFKEKIEINKTSIKIFRCISISVSQENYESKMDQSFTFARRARHQTNKTRITYIQTETHTHTKNKLNGFNLTKTYHNTHACVHRHQKMQRL